MTGASWSKRDAVADPAVASPAVARLAQRAGARLLEHTKVIAVERKGAGFALRTEQGHTVTCGQVVNAAGAWAGDIARHFGEPVPMFAAGPPLFTITPQNAYAGPSLHAVDGTLLLRPGRNGEAVAGSFPRVKADIATGTAMVPEDRVERGLARLAEVVPGLGRMRTGRVWSGVEGYLPDMLPVIGWSRTTPGLLHAFGFSGHGFQLAPGVGAVVADLIVDGASQTPIESFSIERFAGGVVARREAVERVRSRARRHLPANATGGRQCLTATASTTASASASSCSIRAFTASTATSAMRAPGRFRCSTASCAMQLPTASRAPKDRTCSMRSRRPRTR